MDTMPVPNENPMGGETFIITKKTFIYVNGKQMLNTQEVGKPEGFAPPSKVKNLGAI